MKGSDQTYDATEWWTKITRLHTENKFFIKSREDPEKVTGEKTWSAIFISFYLIWLQESWQIFILWDDRFIHTKAHHHSALKWLLCLLASTIVEKIKRTKILSRQILFSTLWGMQVNKTASCLKGAKKMEIWTWYDCIYLLILFNGVRSSLQSRLCFWVSRCAQPRIWAHCNHDIKQIPVKQLRWITERAGRVGSARVQKYCMLFECLSGQVDWE